MNRLRSSESNPRRASADRGEGRLKAILWTVVLVIVVFVAVKIIPSYVAEYQLRDKMQEEARYSVVYHRSEEETRNIIFRVIQDLDIPARREDIKIDASSRVVKISVQYNVPIDFIFYKTEFHFSIDTENKALV